MTRAQVAAGGSAAGRCNPRFVPIDDRAKDGAYHLVRDLAGNQHCARWNGTAFEYGSGNPVAGVITEYASRGAVLAVRAQVAAGGSAEHG